MTFNINVYIVCYAVYVATCCSRMVFVQAFIDKNLREITRLMINDTDHVYLFILKKAALVVR